MVEIIGQNLKKYFAHDGELAICTYSGKELEVWEIEESLFGYMLEQSEDDFFAEAGDNAWWRQADGSILGNPFAQAVINNYALYVWHLDNRGWRMRYDNLLEYLTDHIGATSPKNVCAIITDLARYNEMKISDLMIKYQEDK